MRIIAFVGSPVEDNEKDVSMSILYETLLFFPTVFNCLCVLTVFLQLVKLAKRLKKEKVNVDIINFGEEVRYQHFASFLPTALWKSVGGC